MTQKTIKIFIHQICSKPPKNSYATNKTDVYHIDNIWSYDLSDLKNYGPENNRGFRFVFVVFDNLSKFWCAFPLKNKNA